MKFNIVYEQGGAIKQFRNLREWLDHKGIVYEFKWTDTGKYVADMIIIEDEQDATYFSLTFNHAVKKNDN